MEEWKFTLLTGEKNVEREQIDWKKLMPAEDHTGWLGVDLKRKQMVIEPGAAYPDRPAPSSP